MCHRDAESAEPLLADVRAGDRAAAVDWLGEFAAGGASHICVRFTGSDDVNQMEELIRIREELE